MGRELLPPRDPYITEPLRKKTLFTISADRAGSVTCVRGYRGPHQAVIVGDLVSTLFYDSLVPRGFVGHWGGLGNENSRMLSAQKKEGK